MTHDIKRLLDEELAGQPAPPIGDLVRASMAQGRRIRRNRGLLLGSSGAAGVAVLVVVAALVTGLPGASGESQPVTEDFAGSPPASVSACATASNPANPLVEPGTPREAGAHEIDRLESPRSGADPASTGPQRSDVPAIPKLRCPSLAQEGPLRLVPLAASAAPTGPALPASPAGILELLERLLPAGVTRGAAVGEVYPGDTAITVQIYLDRGQGPGMIRLWISQFERPDGNPSCFTWHICYRLPDGGRITISDNLSDCAGGRTVDLHRADGVFIQASLADCLMWNGSTNPPAPRALTTQEAIDLIMDPRWGTRLPAEIVTIGERRFEELPVIQGG